MRKRGFTLIELLVVVAIIAVLIAILLPSLGRAKANAVRVQCASVLKQWGTVITMYAQENYDNFGLEWDDAQGNKHIWNTLSIGPTPTIYDPEWNSFAAQGRKVSQEFRTCPGDPRYGTIAAAGAQAGTILGANGTGPSIDYAMVRYIPVVANAYIYKTQQCNHPQTTILMADANPSVTGKFNSFSAMSDLDTASGTAQRDALQARHMGIGNVMFMDTHVEQHKYQDFVNNIPSKTVLSGSQWVAQEPYRVWTTLNVP